MTFIPGDYTTVEQWCGGDPEDLPHGLCYYVVWGNEVVLFTGEVMPAGEIQHAAHELAGFIARDPATDRGMVLTDVLKDLMERGSPGDPTLKPVSWREAEKTEAEAIVARSKCFWAAFMLPNVNEQWDFSDDALGTPGAGGHAGLVVYIDATRVVFITWGYPQEVSRAWFDEFCVQIFEVVFQIVT